MLTAQPLFIVIKPCSSSHCGNIQPCITPPISKHCLTFAKKNLQTTTPPLINIKNLRETVSEVYSLSQAILLSCLPSRNSKTNVFEEPPHFPSNAGSHVFPIIHLVMTCFLFKCSKNVLELFRTFLELAGSIKVLNKF